MDNKEFFPDKKVGEEFKLADGTRCVKVSAERLQQISEEVSSVLPGINLTRRSDGVVAIDNIELAMKMIEEIKKKQETT